VFEVSLRLDQDDTVHYRTCAHLDCTGKLPEDVLCLYAVEKDNIRARLLLPLLLEEHPRLPITFTIPCCMTEVLCLRSGKCEITARHRFHIRLHIYWDGCPCLDLDIIRATNTVVSVVEVWCSLERGPSNGNAFECKFGKHQSNGKWKNFNQYYSELELELERSREWSLLSG
jgi:hypothetical protein